MNYVVECQCGHIFVTRKTETQCKCGKRFNAESQPMTVPSLEKSRLLGELREENQKLKSVIEKLIQNYEENQKKMKELIDKFRKSGLI